MPPSELYHQAIEKGKAAVADLDKFREDPSTPTSLEPAYDIEHDTLRRFKPGMMEKVLAHYGIAFSHVEYIEAVPRANTHRDAIYINWFDPTNGVVIANLNNKDKDKAAPEDKTFPSEILWRSWVKVAKKNSVPLSKLRVVVRYFIINEASKAVIKDTWAYSDFTRDEKFHRELTDTDPGFFAVLGSINGYSTMRMLRDHRQAVGFRTVERVLLLKTEDGEIPKDEQAPTFMMLLSSPRAMEAGEGTPQQ